METKQVTMYVAEDGAEFRKKENCELYEAQLLRGKQIIEDLRPNDMVDSDTAIRQDPNKVKEAWKRLYAAAHEFFPYHNDLIEKVEKGHSHHSWLGRMLDDCDDYGKIYKAYCRLSCISDISTVEYEQPYYANNPDEFNGKVIDID